MSFTYNPMSEEECAKEKQFPLLEPGNYSFQIIKATAKQSSSGNPIIELVLQIWDNEGKIHNIFDYLISTKKMEWKTRHFCMAIGILQEYEDGLFNETMCVNKMGKVSIAYQPEKPRPEGGYYRSKNIVEDYLVKDDSIKLDSTVDISAPIVDDDIPF